jgi:bacteriorhodopsin
MSSVVVIEVVEDKVKEKKLLQLLCDLNDKTRKVCNTSDRSKYMFAAMIMLLIVIVVLLIVRNSRKSRKRVVKKNVRPNAP